MAWKELGITALGALQGSIEILLIMMYGYAARSLGLLSHQGERDLSALVTKLSLPALLFTAIGPSATASTISKFWVIIVYSASYQLLCFLYSLLCLKVHIFDSGMWMGACIFNNVLSLPLLMLENLSSSGALHRIERTDGAFDRARTYLLVNALVSHLASFIFGPRMMMSKNQSFPDDSPGPDSPVSEFRATDDHLDPVGEDSHLLSSPLENPLSIRSLWTRLMKYMNPPLLGGLIAIIVGIIPPMHSLFFGNSGAFRASITESIQQVGKLYAALQMLVVGAQLYSSTRSIRQTSVHVFKTSLLSLFLLRFVLMPVFSISTIYLFRKWQPNLLPKDPMFDFALMIAPVGPPAIHLAAIAELANYSDEENGILSRVLMFSYMVTPFISFSIAASLAVVETESFAKQAII